MPIYVTSFYHGDIYIYKQGMLLNFKKKNTFTYSHVHCRTDFSKQKQDMTGNDMELAKFGI